MSFKVTGQHFYKFSCYSAMAGGVVGVGAGAVMGTVVGAEEGSKYSRGKGILEIPITIFTAVLGGGIGAVGGGAAGAASGALIPAACCAATLGAAGLGAKKVYHIACEQLK